MTITLNGEPHDVAAGTTILDLVSAVIDKELGSDGRPADGSNLGVAVAVDSEVIRRGLWSEFVLVDDQSVDIVTAVQGG